MTPEKQELATKMTSDMRSLMMHQIDTFLAAELPIEKAIALVCANTLAEIFECLSHFTNASRAKEEIAELTNYLHDKQKGH